MIHTPRVGDVYRTGLLFFMLIELPHQCVLLNRNIEWKSGSRSIGDLEKQLEAGRYHFCFNLYDLVAETIRNGK